MKSREDIFKKLITILHEEFEVDSSCIALDSNLYSDLDLDSIDAIDLVIRLQEITGRKIKPTTFKSVRTVEEVVSAVEALISNNE